MSRNMDKIDQDMLTLLRQDGRAPLSGLAQQLGISRATAKARLSRLMQSGVIDGFTVRLRQEAQDPVRGLTLIKVEGAKAPRVVPRLLGLAMVRAVHTTNGKWDLIAELSSPDLSAFDDALNDLRAIDGIVESETNLLLTTRFHR